MDRKIILGIAGGISLAALSVYITKAKAEKPPMYKVKLGSPLFEEV